MLLRSEADPPSSNIEAWPYGTSLERRAIWPCLNVATWRRERSDRAIQQICYPVFEAMVPLPRSMASSLLALPRSCHDLGKDTMAMQDRAKANHD